VGFTEQFTIDYKPLKVMVEFSLEQPKGRVEFVTPAGTSKQNTVSINTVACITYCITFILHNS